MDKDLLTDLTNMASGARLDHEDAIADLLMRASVEIERLRAQNMRFSQGLFGGNVTQPPDLMASQGPKQPAYDDKF